MLIINIIYLISIDYNIHNSKSESDCSDKASKPGEALFE
jgi:hypothetical protein